MESSNNINNIIQCILNETQTALGSNLFEGDEKLLLEQWNKSREIVRDEINQNLPENVSLLYCDLLVKHLVILFDPEISLKNNIHKLNTLLLIVVLLSEGNLSEFINLLKYEVNTKNNYFKAIDKLQELLIDWHGVKLDDDIISKIFHSQAFAWKLMAEYCQKEGNRLAADPDYCIDYFPSQLGPYDLLAIAWREFSSGYTCSNAIIEDFNPYHNADRIILYINNNSAILNPDSVRSYDRRINELIFHINMINMSQRISPAINVAIAGSLFSPISVIERYRQSLRL
jgi:hypothetical protein